MNVLLSYLDLGLLYCAPWNREEPCGAAKKRVPPIYDMLVNDNPGPVGLSLANGIKDMRLMVALAQANGHDSPVVSGALARSTAAAVSLGCRAA